MAAKGKSHRQKWSKHETKVLVSLWSEKGLGKGLASVPGPKHPTLHRTTYDFISDEGSHNFT